MVLEEALRLYPPAPLLSRKAIADDELQGYPIAANSMILISPYAMHRHPALWEEPEQFDPERFRSERSAARPAYAYFPFGGGPRICIGNHFAMMEAQLILSTVAQRYQLRLIPVQHGVNSGFSNEELAANRANLFAQHHAHVLDDEYYQSYTPDLSRITVPLLSVANWGGLGLHLRGNIEGYLGAASEYKWLRTIVGNHYTPFYSEEGRAIQARFFDHWLKGHDNGQLAEPRLHLAIRRGTDVSWRDENEWPLARTQWTHLFLDTATRHLDEQMPATEASISYTAPQEGVTFLTEPFPVDTEITGPLALRLWVSSSTDDLDLFVTIRDLDPNGNEVHGIGSSGDPVPVTKGWLRASQQKLDPQRSTEYRPYHSHDEIQKLTPGQIVPVDVEIWPTSMVFEAGHRLALAIEAHDGSGSSMFLHNDPEDRSLSKLAGTNTLYAGGKYNSFLLLPIIP